MHSKSEKEISVSSKSNMEENNNDSNKKDEKMNEIKNSDERNTIECNNIESNNIESNILESNNIVNNEVKKLKSSSSDDESVDLESSTTEEDSISIEQITGIKTQSNNNNQNTLISLFLLNDHETLDSVIRVDNYLWVICFDKEYSNYRLFTINLLLSNSTISKELKEKVNFKSNSKFIIRVLEKTIWVACDYSLFIFDRNTYFSFPFKYKPFQSGIKSFIISEDNTRFSLWAILNCGSSLSNYSILKNYIDQLFREELSTIVSVPIDRFSSSQGLGNYYYLLFTIHVITSFHQIFQRVNF
jgi:hypothetical protein